MDPKYNFVYRIAASLEDELTEIDAGWFDKLSEKARETYIRLHPQSKYARYYRRQIKQAPTDVQQIAPNKGSLKEMKKHQKQIDYAARTEKDPQRKKAFEREAKSMQRMQQRLKDRIDDEHYQGKERARQEKRAVNETRKAEKREADPRKWWEKAIGRENPNAPKPAPKPEPVVQQEPQTEEPPKPKYTQEQLQQMLRPKLAQDVVPNSAMPKVPENGPKPTNVVKKPR